MTGAGALATSGISPVEAIALSHRRHAALNEHFAMIGYLIIAIFVVSWIAAAVVYRVRGYAAREVSHDNEHPEPLTVGQHAVQE